jgi:hypothetical protein
MYVVMVAPLLALWVARGGRSRLLWWGLYGFAMASAWYADSGLVQGMLGPGGIVAGAAVLVAVVVLDVWLISQVARSEFGVAESNRLGR